MFTVVEPVFKTEPLFVFDCTRQQLGVYLKSRFRADIGAESGREPLGTMLTFDGPPWRVVWAASGAMRHAAPVLHEVFHLVTRICADRGIPIVAHYPTGECGDEAAAYLFEFFAKAVLRRLRR